jgi:hypothetical protein
MQKDLKSYPAQLPDTTELTHMEMVNKLGLTLYMSYDEFGLRILPNIGTANDIMQSIKRRMEDRRRRAIR